MYEIVIGGLNTFLGPSQIIFTILGVFIGVIVGVLPGVGPLLGIVLFTPVAIQLDPVTGMGFLIAIYVGGSCGGAISAIILRIPGTPLAAATLLDGYPMAKKGKAPQAVGIAFSASSTGGLIGGLGLIFIAPFLAEVALKFGPPEYFALTLIGLICIAVIARESTIKGLLSACFGLIIASIGTDPITGDDRFSFGFSNLMGGINIVALVVGLFAISEMLFQIQKGGLNLRPTVHAFRAPFSSIFIVFRDIINTIRSSLIGTFIGSLPAVGGVTSSFVSYALAKASSKEPEKFGTGVSQGIVATESANNAGCGGAMIPSFALAIPGDPGTAVLLSALLLIGFIPGPTLFTEHPDTVGGIFYTYISANIFLFFLGILFTPLFIKIIQLKKSILIPLVVLLSIVGTYAVQSSLFDVWCMWAFGLIGFVMRRTGFPLAPLVIARVLSPVMEPAFRRSLIVSGGSFSIFVSRPLSLTILIIAALVLVWSFIPPAKMREMRAFISNCFRKR